MRSESCEGLGKVSVLATQYTSQGGGINQRKIKTENRLSIILENNSVEANTGPRPRVHQIPSQARYADLLSNAFTSVSSEVTHVCSVLSNKVLG